MTKTLSLVDSHCHLDRLDLSNYQGNLGAALVAAQKNHVDRFLCVSIDLASYPMMLRIVEPHAQVHVSVGVHPSAECAQEPTTAALTQLADHPKVVAIGETGLDYFYNKGDLRWQRQRFRTHIQAAIETGKPLIIHSRDAKQDTLDILRQENAERVGGVMHCFTEDWEMAKQCIDLGFYISFSGIVTFKNADTLREVAKKIPIERMLVETDSPYLAPVPKRGQPNEPANVLYIAEFIAKLRDIPLQEIAIQTTENFHHLFIRTRQRLSA